MPRQRRVLPGTQNVITITSGRAIAVNGTAVGGGISGLSQNYIIWIILPFQRIVLAAGWPHHRLDYRRHAA